MIKFAVSLRRKRVCRKVERWEKDDVCEGLFYYNLMTTLDVNRTLFQFAYTHAVQIVDGLCIGSSFDDVVQACSGSIIEFCELPVG